MTTELRRPVYRQTAEPYDHKGRKLIIGLLPGDVIEIREARTRRRFTAPLRRVFQAILVWTIDAEKPKRRKITRGKL